MGEKTSGLIPKYFAAANTFSGFVSFFDSVFPSTDYSRIYVLKGGPGTGKSSFMKKASAHFHARGYYVEEIYCSSDPHSLDGVIIENGDNRVAILDGTAPHERDAKIPGAIDELINLGEGWDERILVGRREEIVSLQNEKTKSYKSAYYYLSIAGKSQEAIDYFYKSNFDNSKAKSKAESFLSKIRMENKGIITTRLISSFGRYGSYSLDTLNSLAESTIRISGRDAATDIFMGIFLNELISRNANIIRFPKALNPGSTDAIYLPDSRLAIVRDDEGEINSEELLNLSEADSERIRASGRVYAEALEEARRWFAIASDIHFRLEEIYGQAMDFDRNNEMLNEKILQIENILENV